MPLWRYLAATSPEELSALVDFRYLEDALRPDEALELSRLGSEGKASRIEELETNGYPAHTTAPGWLGYSDEHLVGLCNLARREGFEQVKLKVGGSLEDDLRRCRLARDAIGTDIGLAVDANQVWGVEKAIERVRRLEEFDLAWIEEPTSPDDILGHARIRAGVRPVPVATGENVPNRVVFKQLLQGGAIDIMQIDACRVAGVPENLSNLSLAAKFGIPVCPHAGGVGLCEIVQHFSFSATPLCREISRGGVSSGSTTYMNSSWLLRWSSTVATELRVLRELPRRCTPSRSRSTHSRTAQSGLVRAIP